jgi:hypothetical protein
LAAFSKVMREVDGLVLGDNPADVNTVFDADPADRASTRLVGTAAGARPAYGVPIASRQRIAS